jgi:hypothetical protein
LHPTSPNPMKPTRPDLLLTEADVAALTRSIELAQAESAATRQQIDDMIRERGWERAARFAAYCCQDRALRLKPWMSPPCWLRTDAAVKAALAAPAPDLGGRRAAGQLVERLLAAGLSRYEPDPEAALARKALN